MLRRLLFILSLVSNKKYLFIGREIVLLVKNPAVEIAIQAFLERGISNKVAYYSFYRTVKVLPINSV